MLERVPVAAVAVDTKPGEIESNLEKIDSWTSRAAAGGAHLVLFPELSLSGFIPNHPPQDHESVAAPGAGRSTPHRARP